MWGFSVWSLYLCLFMFLPYSRRPGWGLRIWQRHITRKKPKGLAERLHWTTKSKEDAKLWRLCEKPTSAGQGSRGGSFIFLWHWHIRLCISKGVKALMKSYGNNFLNLIWITLVLCFMYVINLLTWFCPLDLICQKIKKGEETEVIQWQRYKI